MWQAAEMMRNLNYLFNDPTMTGSIIIILAHRTSGSFKTPSETFKIGRDKMKVDAASTLKRTVPNLDKCSGNF